jgi:ribonuclease R
MPIVGSNPSLPTILKTRVRNDAGFLLSGYRDETGPRIAERAGAFSLACGRSAGLDAGIRFRPMPKTPEDLLLEALAKPDYVPARVDDLIDGLGLDKKDERHLKISLQHMLTAGTVVIIKGDRIALPSTADLVAGTVLFRAGGSARLVPDAKPDAVPGTPAPESIHIHAEDTGIALHGDKVVVRLNPEERRGGGGRPQRKGESSRTARVIRILSRANDTMPGTLRKTRLFWYVVPDDPRIARDILVPEPEKSGLSPLPKENDKVVVRMGEWEQRHLNPVGEIIEVLGETHTPMAEYKAILRKYHLNPEFPTEVVEQVAGIPDRVLPEEAEGRMDFRKILTLTIDPDDAKDFDDALSVERMENGDLRVGIHIADVSHYVRPGSPLDKEARLRANSTYLVGTVVPMIPHALSSGLCSLVEGEDRLTKAIIMTFDKDAQVVKTEAANTIIHSQKRLTYKQAYGFMTLDDLESIRALPMPAKHHSGSPGRTLSTLEDDELLQIRTAIRDMWSVASKLRAARFRKGSLDLDMSETKIFCDAEGYAERAEIIHNDESHQLIEEFMLLANEHVAKLLSAGGLAHLSRVHDEPDVDKLSDLRQELLAGGIKVGDLTKREEVVKLLKIIKSMENGLPLRIRFLRSLKQAQYRASADGHYGLAKEDYSHFTSPIRRYADLVEHRIFDFHLSRIRAATAPRYKTTQYEPADLHQIADHISSSERNSTEAERDSVKVKLMELFEREVNKRDRAVFDAVITDVRNHGFNVELSVSQAYGLVHLSTLTDDFYVLTQDGTSLIGRRTKREYRAGDKVKVTVDRVDRFKRMLDFRIVPSDTKGAPAAAAPGDSHGNQQPQQQQRREGHVDRGSRGGRDERRGGGFQKSHVRDDRGGKPGHGHGQGHQDRPAQQNWQEKRPEKTGRGFSKPVPAPEPAAEKTGFVGRLVRRILGGKPKPVASEKPPVNVAGKLSHKGGSRGGKPGPKGARGHAGEGDSGHSGKVERRGKRR